MDNLKEAYETVKKYYKEASKKFKEYANGFVLAQCKETDKYYSFSILPADVDEKGFTGMPCIVDKKTLKTVSMDVYEYLDVFKGAKVIPLKDVLN